MSNPETSGRRQRFGAVCLWTSAILWLGVTSCFIGRWDRVAAVTLFPYWSWALAGLLACYAAMRMHRNRRGLIVMVLWIVATLMFADNLVSMLRLLRRDSSAGVSPEIRLRVVTLNCAGRDAGAEIGRLKPDLVLLQEIPSTNTLSRMAREWFGDAGSMIAGWDCAILSRVPVEPAGSNFPPQYVQALMQLPNGGRVLVTSLRLVPPAGRFDLWNPAAWRSSAENRRLRRRQLEEVLERAPGQAAMPELFGGDFNAPTPDTVFDLLEGFQDAHSVAGRGWGNTALNTLPVARPDRIWCKQLRPVSCRALRTQNSDHRLVVVEVEVSR